MHDLSNVEWEVFGFPMYLYPVSIIVKPWLTKVKKEVPSFPFISFVLTHSKGEVQGHHAVDVKEYRTSAKYLFDNLQVLQKIYDMFCKEEKRFYELLEKGEQYILLNYDEFLRAYTDAFATGAAIDGFLVYSQEYLSSLTTYDKRLTYSYGETFSEREQESLASINISHKTKEEILSDDHLMNLFKKHQNEFYWIHNSYVNFEKIPIESFIDSALESKFTKFDYSAHQVFCDSLKQKHEKLWWIGMIAWWNDRRKEINLRANYFIGCYLQQLSKEKNIDYNLIVESCEGDILDLCERKKEWVLYVDDKGDQEVLAGEKASTFWKKHFETKDYSSENSVKGMGVYGGKIQGRVKVVEAAKSATIDKGDVLVAPMTRPDYLPLMRKAAAFVTDEGGITSHAAIVAREMKKPCVIGTKFATKVLKDGDLVEVDADTGVVRIIS